MNAVEFSAIGCAVSIDGWSKLTTGGWGRPHGHCRAKRYLADFASGDIRYWVIGNRQGLAFRYRRIGTGGGDLLGWRAPHGQVFEDAFDDTGILER